MKLSAFRTSTISTQISGGHVILSDSDSLFNKNNSKAEPYESSQSVRDIRFNSLIL